MLTIDSLAKRGHQAEDLSYFPCWKKEEAALETKVLRSCDMNIMSLPYCHHGFGIKDGGLTLKAWVSFELERLHRVRQLAFVKHPFVLSMAGDIDEGLCFDHSRGMHVLDVMSVITLIAENNRSELPLSHRTLTPIYNTLRLAALTHDALTPAGGDTIKTLDPEALDEDAHYFDLFRDPETSEERIALCVKYGVNIHDLTETVQGKGLAGTVLDMADKTAYVARDTSQFMNYCFASRRRKIHFPEYASIAKLVEKDPWICGWWESVRVKRDYAWVEDGERLGRFLELRLRMFRGLYYHGKRTMDIILPVVVAGHLYASGQLTRADLLQMSDEQLERRIAKFCGVPHATCAKSRRLKPAWNASQRKRKRGNASASSWPPVSPSCTWRISRRRSSPPPTSSW